MNSSMRWMAAARSSSGMGRGSGGSSTTRRVSPVRDCFTMRYTSVRADQITPDGSRTLTGVGWKGTPMLPRSPRIMAPPNVPRATESATPSGERPR